MHALPKPPFPPLFSISFVLFCFVSAASIFVVWERNSRKGRREGGGSGSWLRQVWPAQPLALRPSRRLGLGWVEISLLLVAVGDACMGERELITNRPTNRARDGRTDGYREGARKACWFPWLVSFFFSFWVFLFFIPV
ncbi:hypothetical protein B0T19DRAFT_47261 [Cercophora scortea]|uniref:Uncharacterized protein n=1 Tax=Cercophora scortea TaxID=314031 RepID=A0AAE0J4C7_9PEZI|nr:hypothetical protein B0T19DRAFT_47261 [Cercophora scortea]